MKKQFCSLERMVKEQDELPSRSEIRYEFPRFLGAFVMELTTGRIIDGVPCGRIGMAIKYLDLEPKIDSMMRDFLNSSRWEKLNKETSSKILPSGDGSRGINTTLKKEDLDDLFGSLYEEYYKTRNPEVSTDFNAPNTLNNEDTPSSSTIVVDDNEAPQKVSTSEEPTSPIPNDFVDE
ncbi:hypothetical protein Tco_0829193 [Tanacetum coccineum]